jgi:hypothetical protein
MVESDDAQLCAASAAAVLPLNEPTVQRVDDGIWPYPLDVPSEALPVPGHPMEQPTPSLATHCTLPQLSAYKSPRCCLIRGLIAFSCRLRIPQNKL